jgi:hypothetical protein
MTKDKCSARNTPRQEFPLRQEDKVSATENNNGKVPLPQFDAVSTQKRKSMMKKIKKKGPTDLLDERPNTEEALCPQNLSENCLKHANGDSLPQSVPK